MPARNRYNKQIVGSVKRYRQRARTDPAMRCATHIDVARPCALRVDVRDKINSLTRDLFSHSIAYRRIRRVSRCVPLSELLVSQRIAVLKPIKTTRTTFAELKTRIRHSSATHHFSPPEPSSSIKPVFAFVARRICCHHLRHLSPRELSKPFFPHNRISNVSTCVGFQDPAAPRYAAKGFWYVLYFLCPNVSSPWRAILYLEYVRHSACTPILAVFDSDGNS